MQHDEASHSATINAPDQRVYAILAAPEPGRVLVETNQSESMPHTGE